MIKYLLAALLLAPQARAACPLGGGPLDLEIPNAGSMGTEWPACIRRDLMKLSTAAVANSTTSTPFLGTLGVSRITGLSTGTAGVRLSSAIYQDSGFYFTTRSSMSVEGAGGLGVTYGVVASTLTLTPLVNDNGLKVKESDGGNDAIVLAANASRGYVQVLSGGTAGVQLHGNGDNYFTGASAKVGIGTASPYDTVVISSGGASLDGTAPNITFYPPAATQAGLNIGGVTNAVYLTDGSNPVSSANLQFISANSTYHDNGASGAAIFRFGGTEKARIDANNLLMAAGSSITVRGGIYFATSTTNGTPNFFLNPANGRIGFRDSAPTAQITMRLDTGESFAIRQPFGTTNSVFTVANNSGAADVGLWDTVGNQTGRFRGNALSYILSDKSGNFGVGTSAPATQLDVDGTAQFGLGAAKSTFTATGNLQIVGSTFTTSGGMFTAPSQYFTSVSSPTNTQIPTGAHYTVFWVNEDTDTANGFVSSSSGTLTATAAGLYEVRCQLSFVNPTSEIEVKINGPGNQDASINCDPISGTPTSCQVSSAFLLSAGDAVICQAYTNNATYLQTSRERSFFQAYKLR